MNFMESLFLTDHNDMMLPINLFFRNEIKLNRNVRKYFTRKVPRNILALEF